MILDLAKLSAPPDWDGSPWIVYDWNCPFCSNYASYAKLRTRLARLTLVSAREHATLGEWLLRQGADLDEGMVVLVEGALYHGADAMTFLADHISPKSKPGQLLNSFFRNKRWSAAVYPYLRGSRNLVLRTLGRAKLMPNHARRRN